MFIALQQYKLSFQECCSLLAYFFSIQEIYITRIIKQYEELDYADVIVEHYDLDLIYIEAFVRKINRQAKEKTRQLQAAPPIPNLFENS